MQLARDSHLASRYLPNAFPFNQNEQRSAAPAPVRRVAQAAPEPRIVSQQLDSRSVNQGSDDTDVSFGAIAVARSGSDGKKCIDKVEMVEETEYYEIVQCDHSYDRRCHTTYVTNESQQEEECEENFRKNCFINYEKIVDNETVEVCRTEYKSECWPKQEEHDVEDDVVECENIQKEKCEDETSGYTTQTKWPSEVYKKYNLVSQCTKEIQNVVAYTEEPVWGFVVDMPVYRTKAGQINIGTTVQKVPELLESGIDEKRFSKLDKCKPDFFRPTARSGTRYGWPVTVPPRSRRSATPSTRRSRMLGTTSSLLVSAFLLLPLLLLLPPPPALRQTSPPLLSTTLSPTTLPPTTPLFQRLKRRNHGQSCVCTSSSSSLHPQPAKIKFRRVGLVPWISFKLHLKIFQFLFSFLLV